MLVIHANRGACGRLTTQASGVEGGCAIFCGGRRNHEPPSILCKPLLGRHGFPEVPSGCGARSRSWRPTQQAGRAQVFVQTGPVISEPAPGAVPGVHQTRKLQYYLTAVAFRGARRHRHWRIAPGSPRTSGLQSAPSPASHETRWSAGCGCDLRRPLKTASRGPSCAWCSHSVLSLNLPTYAFELLHERRNLLEHALFHGQESRI